MSDPAGGLPTVFIETYGCQMNVYDSQAMRGLLDSGGFAVAESVDAADVVLLNTCSVREHAEHRVISRVGELRHRQKASNAKSLIGICGCMAERLGNDLVQGHGVDLVVGVDQYDQLPDMLHALLAKGQKAGKVRTGHRGDMHYVAPPEAYPRNNSHLVTIHKGCDYRCTYCIVPETRGPQREKAPAAILAEIARIVAAGGTEVTLLGQNVTAYRWREDLDFAGLLRQVAQLEGLQRIRFLTGHPRDMSDTLLHAIAEEEKVCPWLHIPLQSGSDRILRRMKRLYTCVDYLQMIEKARRWIPGVTFSSDFIVGFPGETEADFQATLAAVRVVGYDQIFSFKYSERPGVPAAHLADDVSLKEKKRRLAELMSVQEKVWQGLAAAQIGQNWRGIVEGRARRPADTWKLRTANNRKVLLEAASFDAGDEVSVRIVGIDKTTFLGESVPREY